MKLSNKDLLEQFTQNTSSYSGTWVKEPSCTFVRFDWEMDEEGNYYGTAIFRSDSTGMEFASTRTNNYSTKTEPTYLKEGAIVYRAYIEDFESPDGKLHSEKYTVTIPRLESYGYAAYMENGDLMFFRSIAQYSASSTPVTVVDVLGNSYNAQALYTNVENRSITSVDKVPWYAKRNLIKNVYVADGQYCAPVNMAHWFETSNSIVSFNAKGFEFDKVTTMYQMFYNSGVQSVDFSNHSAPLLTNTSQMFYGCKKLKEVNFNNFIADKITGISFGGSSTLETLNLNGFSAKSLTSISFSGLSGLKSLDLRSIDTSNIKSFDSMFSGCSGLTYLNLSNFNTSNATSMRTMFKDCSSLTSIDVSKFDTSKAGYINSMFEGCTSVKYLDLSNFDTSKVYSMRSIFKGCDSLTQVKLGTKFTVWSNNAYLPEGTWKKGNYSYTERELYAYYTTDIDNLAGTWTKQ